MPKEDLNGRNTPINTAKEARVLRRYQKTENFTSDAAFAESLGESKQVLWHWFNGVNSPTNDWLRALALEQVGNWQGDMAVEILNLRNPDFVPCVCLTYIGDNGRCPKHGTLETAESQPLTAES